MSGDIDAKRLRRALTAKGFEEMPGDHHFYVLVVDKKRTRIRTKVSHGEKSIGKALASVVARQMRISRAELDAFVACTLSGSDYAVQAMREP